MVTPAAGETDQTVILDDEDAAPRWPVATRAGIWLLYLTLLAGGCALGLHLAEGPQAFSAVSAGLAGLGVIGLWRYGWWFVHYCRSSIYRWIVFPRLRREAERAAAQVPRPPLYIVVTSYKIDIDITLACYHALIEESSRYGAPVHIVCGIRDVADEHLIRQIAESFDPATLAQVRLVMVPQEGTGKRDAIAACLRAIRRRAPAPDAIVALIDGDVIVTPGAFERSVIFFAANPDLGGLTVNNRTTGHESALARDWYDLRFAQRDLLMGSMALSRRLLVLTGRLSLIRGDIATDSGFIGMVEDDYIHHWHHGRIRMLTGDDKSSWFWLMKHGWEMIYLPDVVAVSVERLPSAGFVDSSIRLMKRWFGNMLRTNGRAIRLGPRRMGWFVWWSLIDQRLSIFTSMSGPAFALTAAAFGLFHVVPLYLAWVLMTRLALSLVLAPRAGRYSPVFVVLLYYNQVVGAVLKFWILFNLDVQRWTRQKISSGGRSNFASRFRRGAAVAMQGVACIALLVLLIDYVGVGGQLDFRHFDVLLANFSGRT